MLILRVMLVMFVLKFVVMAIYFKKKSYPKSVFWVGLGIALIFLISFIITFFIQI